MTVLATTYVDWASMWKILVISVLAGAGLVTVYSLGLRALSASGYLRGSDEQPQGRRNALALVGAAGCLLIVVASAIYGIHVIFTKG
jgi:hypothetical protein